MFLVTKIFYNYAIFWHSNFRIFAVAKKLNQTICQEMFTNVMYGCST